MDLSKFINQHVDITLRNGCTMTDVLVTPNPYSYRSGFIYPFLIVQEGIFINAYTRDGMLRNFSEDSRDIIKIQSHSNSD